MTNRFDPDQIKRRETGSSGTGRTAAGRSKSAAPVKEHNLKNNTSELNLNDGTLGQDHEAKRKRKKESHGHR